MRREYGGEFSALDAARAAELPPGPLLHEVHRGVTLWGSGRAALRALVAEKRWKRIWIPSYICAEVLDALPGIEVVRYVDHPLLSPAGLPGKTAHGDVVLRVSYFGLRGADEAGRSQGEVIEDHTHDPTGPWARASRAPYALASLRKTYPTPDGGALWSPSGAALPAEREATAAHLAAADSKLHAMELKARFLRGGGVAKEDYRRLSGAGETRIGSLSGAHPETRALVGRVSPVALAAARRAAWERLAAARPDALSPCGDPFALVLDAGARRDALVRALVAEGVFPSILWPLSWWRSDSASRKVSRRLLTVPCDFRYPLDVVEEVATLLRALA